MSGEPIRFLLVGAGGYGVNLGVFAGLHALGTRYATASVSAYLVSNALMYLGNRRFTFRLGWDGFWSGYGRYFLVGLVVAALTVALLSGAVEGLGADSRAAQALALAAATPVAFVLNKRWTFA